MNYRTTLTSTISKSIGIIMTIAFSLVTFTQAQNCTLPLGWTTSFLADGQSRTGYQITGATFAQTCTGASALLTCTSGVISPNINIYKYPSCTPQTWNNCTIPTGANHLEYRTLYRLSTNTPNETCQQLSQSLQCLNGVFTGGTSPRLYTHATCTTQNWMQCLDIRTNALKDNGETITAYAASSPSIGQTCLTLKRTLTCYNGQRSGGNQSSLFTGCTNPPSFSGCVNIRVSPAITVPHNSSLNAYTNSISPVGGTCNDILKPLTCINGMRSGNGINQQTGLYSGCTQANTASCPNIISTGTMLHGSFITVFTQNEAKENNNESCTQFAVTAQCIDGQRSGYNSQTMHTGCQNIASGSCYNNLTDIYVPHLQSVFIYTDNAPTTGFGCDSIKIPVYCNATNRYSGSALGALIGSGLSPTFYGTCGGCILPRGDILAEGTLTGAYSRTSVDYPQSCSNFSTTLICGSGGVIQGNRQTYQYSGCASIGLMSGVSITIDESPERNDYMIAQGSSPAITITFGNKGDTDKTAYGLNPGFLTCKRIENNINVYNSNTINEFTINAGTKLGITIRLKAIFTQSVGKKTVVCTINPSMINDDYPTLGKSWTGTFEIVEADRFDLALSRSIDPISKNLEAAEGAKGTRGLQNFLFDRIMNVLVPLIIILGILSAILGFYKLMFSSDENAIKEGSRYIIYGIIGIILIMSAKFIGQNVYDILNPVSGEIVGTSIAVDLYERILYPFIKLAIYLVLGVMFIILLSRVITFIFGSDADAQKKAGTLIGRNIISMLVIIGAKQIVEAIYGKQQDVIREITNLGEIGSGILEDKNIPIIWQVLNYALGIASLVILVIIIIQTVKLLMKPDDPAQVKNIKNSLFYMFLGILVLGAGYLIVNFAIIN